MTEIERIPLWLKASAVAFMSAMATFVQSHVLVKVLFIGAFVLCAIAAGVARGKPIFVPARVLWFYLCIGVTGALWGLVGLFEPRNYSEGVTDAIRLYVAWSVVFVFLFSLLRGWPSIEILHNVMVTAGILVPVVNFIGLYDEYAGLGIISDATREAMDMQIGFGEGYIQITSQNIGVMFMIAPYLMAWHTRPAGGGTSLSANVALVLSLILVVVSGRRALWLVTAVTPFLILGLSLVSGQYSQMAPRSRKFLWIVAFASVMGSALLLASADSLGGISRLKDAFGSEDERTIQKPYLIRAFTESPFFGSGFGGAAAYLRNTERPWTGYELTYHQMLFNTGLVGVTFLGAVFAAYFLGVVQLLRRFRSEAAIPFSLMVGYCGFFLGAYSNRYFGSFDLLFFVGLLPYLSTFRNGFDKPLIEGTA